MGGTIYALHKGIVKQMLILFVIILQHHLSAALKMCDKLANHDIGLIIISYTDSQHGDVFGIYHHTMVL